MPITTLPDVPSKVSYIATAGQTVFPFPFKFFTPSDIHVWKNNVALILSTEFTTAGAGLDAGMQITLIAPAALNDVIRIERHTPHDRMANYPLTGPMAIAALNTEQTRHVAMIQEIGDQLDEIVDQTEGGSLVGEAPDDGKYYARRNKTWIDGDARYVNHNSHLADLGQKADITYVDAQDEALGLEIDTKASLSYVDSQDTALAAVVATKIPDAPSDGNEYVRKSQAWAVMTPSGGEDLGAAEFNFSDAITEPVGDRQIRFNHATAASVTKVWIDYDTAGGTDIRRMLALVQQTYRLLIQEKADVAKWQRFIVNGPPVDKTTYWEFPVVFDAGGTALIPSRCLLAFGEPGTSSGGITDAGSDGLTYGRRNAAWERVVRVSGDTMTGHLTLPAGPSDQHAVRKDYVDDAIAARAPVLLAKVTMPADSSLVEITGFDSQLYRTYDFIFENLQAHLESAAIALLYQIGDSGAYIAGSTYVNARVIVPVTGSNVSPLSVTGQVHVAGILAGNLGWAGIQSYGAMRMYLPPLGAGAAHAWLASRYFNTEVSPSGHVATSNRVVVPTNAADVDRIRFFLWNGSSPQQWKSPAVGRILVYGVPDGGNTWGGGGGPGGGELDLGNADNAVLIAALEDF